MLSSSTRRPINTIQKDEWRRELLPTNVIKLTDGMATDASLSITVFGTELKTNL